MEKVKVAKGKSVSNNTEGIIEAADKKITQIKRKRRKK